MDTVDNLPPAGVLPLVENLRLGIFAKQPSPGRVKTRLCPPLSPQEAAEFARICLDETVQRLSGSSFALTLFFDGDEDYFRMCYPGVERVAQGQGDLGQRMERAMEYLLEQGGGAALVGSDSPDLPLERIGDVQRTLRSAEVVTIGAKDGGYVLIAQSRHYPRLFRQMPWSTSRVLALTRCRAAEDGLAYQELGVWEDVDDLESLRRLVGRSPDSLCARFVRARLAHHL